MIYIDSDVVEMDDKWLAKAAEAVALLEKAPDEKVRRKILDSYAYLWTRVKPKLELLSHGKCWYCESRQSRSYMVVDHFRPKGAVKDSGVPHDGYWWLAFDVTNYRYSCTFCNSPSRGDDGVTRGKVNYFPLLDESKRARAVAELGGELPILLDPTCINDPPLLYFGMDGYVRPNPRLCPAGSLRLQRASKTIDLMNLNHRGIRDRRKTLYRSLKREFKRALDLWPGFSAEEEPATSQFLESIEILRKAAVEAAEYTAAARSFLRGQRQGDGVALEVLAAVE